MLFQLDSEIECDDINNEYTDHLTMDTFARGIDIYYNIIKEIANVQSP